MTAENLPAGAVALRPVVVDDKNDRFINYSATTFKGDARHGCEIAVAHLLHRGFITKECPGASCRSHAVLDVLDDDGMIIADFHLTREGLQFLRREWNIGPRPEPRYASHV